MRVTEPSELPARARRNRELILAAAAHVFAERGERAPMHEVARRAGLGVGTIYRHFPTKDVLAGELLAQKFQVLTGLAGQALAQDDAWNAFRGWLTASVELLTQEALTAHALRRSGAVWRYARPAYFELEAMLDQLIRRAQRESKMRPDFAARELLPLTVGLCSCVYGRRRHLEIVLDGLRAR